MKKQKNILTFSLLLTASLLLSACAAISGPSTDSDAAEENVVTLENPAAVYCEGLGYAMETVERDGGEDADCILPDDTRCAQWDFLAGRCGQAFTYCELEGGTIVDTGVNIGTCRFADGSICDEYCFFSGNCSPGDNP